MKTKTEKFQARMRTRHRLEPARHFAEGRRPKTALCGSELGIDSAWTDQRGQVSCRRCARSLQLDWATVPSSQARDQSNGRYSFDGDMTKLCRCGHPLGLHAAGAPHDCMHPLKGPEPPCACQRFALARKRSRQ